MNELFKAIYDRLTAQLSETIYDHVPQDTIVFPYVRVDPIELSNNDVDDKTGFNGDIKIISYSRYRGSKEISDLNLEIYNALHQWDFPNTASYSISSFFQDVSSIITDDDGLTRVSIQRFTLIFEPL